MVITTDSFADLAALYEVEVKVLNQAVKRNIKRFPADFMFQLTTVEAARLRSQIVTLKTKRGQHRKYPPYAFTEHGAIMAAPVLNSPRAVEVSVFVVRAFVKLRELSITHKEIAKKLNELERKVTGHDQAIAGLINAIRELMTPSEQPRRGIGFHVKYNAPSKRKASRKLGK